MIRKMGLEFKYFPIDLFMLGSLRMENRMARENIFGLLGNSMKVIGGMERNMVLGFGILLGERSMMDSGDLENLKDMELSLQKMVILMRDSSKMDFNTVREYKNLSMEICTEEVT